MAYNTQRGRMNDLRAKGGIVKAGQMQLSGETTKKELPKEMTKPVRVYNPGLRGAGLGPLSAKATNYQFYDLLMSDEDQEIRESCFEDWIFPRVVMNVDRNKVARKFIVPSLILERGGGVSPDGVRQIGSYTTTEYVFILLNPMKELVQDFGLLPGMIPQRTNYLVCVEIGDPRTGRLDNAFIQYALSMNQPIAKVIESATAERVGPLGIQHFYRLNGDQALEKELYEKWFNDESYYFTSVIYPKVRHISDYLR